LALREVEKGGQDALTVAGSATVLASNCAFGPHASAFMFEGGDDRGDRLTAQHCTVMTAAGDWAAFRFAEGAACDALDVQHCLFARAGEAALGVAMMPGDQPNKAVLIRQAATPGKVRFEGRDNRYYRLDGY